MKEAAVLIRFVYLELQWTSLVGHLILTSIPLRHSIHYQMFWKPPTLQGAALGRC